MTEISRIPRTLAENEAVIEKYRASFIHVAQALADIKAEKQYKTAGFETFEDYCQERWQFSAKRGYQLIEAAEVVENVNHGRHSAIMPPDNERQTRAVAEASDDPQEQGKIWEEAVKATDGKPTAKAVKEAAAKVKAEADPVPEREATTDNPENLRVIIVDAMDGPVADSLHGDWDSITEFRSIGTAVGSLLKRVKDLAETPGGRKIPFVKVQKLAKELQLAMKFAKPHTECFKCQRKIKTECGLCGGSGWLNETEYSRNRTEGGDRWLKSRE